MRVKNKIRYGPLLEEIRLKSELSTTQVAAKLGLAESAVRHYEKGRSRPDGVALIRYVLLGGPVLGLRLITELEPEFRALWERPLQALAREAHEELSQRQLQKSGRIDSGRKESEDDNAGLKSLPQTPRPSTTETADLVARAADEHGIKIKKGYSRGANTGTPARKRRHS